MKERRPLFEWCIFAICVFNLNVYCETDKPQWSKPEQSISAENNDWIPVQGKCPTCRPNRDLETQATNEQIGQVLTPPRSPSVSSVPAPLSPQLSQTQQLQFTNKQPRILPFGPNSPQLNNPYVNTENKQYQGQPTKLYSQESQKQFYQFESPFVKQPYNLAPQQLIPQSVLSQSPISQQRYPINEPYPFTLPLKGHDATTPKILYQPKIRFPDNEPPKVIPNNKITSQSTDEIQLLYVPIEATQRGRKNMKEMLNQNQYQPPLPHGFVAPQYNFQYSSIPKQPETQFYFPSNIPSANNYLQLNPVPPQRPETIYTNLTKNFLQPYFTINGLYSPLSQLPQLPNKQEIPYYNVLPQELYNTNPIKSPEQVFKAPLPNPPRPVQPIPAPGGMFLHNSGPNTIPTFADVYAPTTPENFKNSEYVTEKSGLRGADKVPEFTYQFVTSNPQTSASQNQHFISDNKLTLPPQNIPQFTQTPIASKIPQKVSSQATFDETTNPNYPVPHQPPLSFYMEKVHNPKINDVLYLLKDSKTIPVLDTLENDPPQVFVGPSELPSPKGYIKFELPYLSSLDYNRIERMIDKLPFFVAPLNFKPPPGYSKIPFPAPHIGSVVLSNNSGLQESLHDKPFEQKYKPSTQPFSASPELSTITPQLTSQINSLLETPSSIPAELTSFKNLIPASSSAPESITYRTYSSQTEEVTKKPLFKSSQRTSTTTTTEASKRTGSSNRQRKPIYRGYPTTSTETTTTRRESIHTTESSHRFHVEPARENENYVEFTAKGKFSMNNGNENVILSSPSLPGSTRQIPSLSSTYQVQSDYSNFFPNYENIPPQNLPENNYDNQKSTQNIDFYSSSVSGNSVNQNYPYYSSQILTDVKPETTSNLINNGETKTTQPTNFNFNNIKPLSQYNPYNADQNRMNHTETKTTKEPVQSNANEFNFWTQDQFYKVNPSAIEYYSSTTKYPQEISSAIPESPRTSKTTTTSTTTTYAPETNFVSDYQKLDQNKDYLSSTESAPQVTPTTLRPRFKQRIYPNRHHQSKHTTEKENVDSQSYRTSTRLPLYSESTNESSTQSADLLLQSTENHEASSTRTDVKPHRRRRPVRPQSANIVTPVTEVSSSTSRNFRTRPTRHPSSVTERYRGRRPTTSSESTETLNSEWSSYNTYVPSASGFNDINNNANDNQNNKNNEQKYSSTYWTDSSSINQNTVSEVSSTTEEMQAKSTKDEINTENVLWLAPTSKESSKEYSIYSPTAPNQQFSVENNIENQTEVASERKDETYSEIKNTFAKPLKTTYYEEPSSTVTTDTHEKSKDEYESDSVYSQETKKDRYSEKDNFDGQKKAYDPHDEKKNSGKRRLAFVRRFRINKRPQDVLEAAESQNLGRVTDNSLQSSDSKVFSKTEEKDYYIPKPNIINSSPTVDYVVPTEATTEKDDEVRTPPTTTFSPSISTTISPTMTLSETDEYVMQNDFAQMLSDFLNSNDQPTKSVNNLERNNVTTEKSISYILSLNNRNNEANVISNSSSSIFYPTNTPTPTEIPVVNGDDTATIANSQFNTNTEYAEHSTTTEESAETSVPNLSLATSTTTEISLETEICYRGKCVKTKKSKASDLLPVE